MATRHKGSGATLKVAPSGDTQVDISVEAVGLDGINLSEVEDTREVPGGGSQRTSQQLGYKEGSSTYTVDENDTTAPLFVGRSGQKFDHEYSPEGVETGKPKNDFVAFAEISHSFEARGVRRFSVTMYHSGLIARGTH